MITTLLAFVAVAKTAFLSSNYAKSAKTDKGIVQLSTAAQRLTREGKPDIWLVGAIHIGSKDYYQSLQKLLDQNSMVLYEGVKPGEKKDPAEAKPSEQGESQAATTKKTPIYQVLSDALGLQFQLVSIDYSKPSWKNCDLTWAEMDKLNQEAKAKGGSGQLDQIKQLLDPNSPMAAMLTQMLQTATPGTKEGIKLLLVTKAGQTEGTGFDPATEAIVVKARNHVVMDRVEFELTAPTPLKSIGIFYGAAHLDDMEKTLTSKYGYKLAEKKWFLAVEADPSKLDALGKMIVDSANKVPPAGSKSGEPAKTGGG